MDTDEINVEITDQEILALATKIEQEGEVFYRFLAENISDPKAADFFKKMAREETQHEKQFARFLHEKGGRAYGWERKRAVRELIQRQFQTDIFPSIGEIENKMSNFEAVHQVIDFVIEVEKTSAEFYSLLCEYCTNFEAKTFLTQLENAELEHLKAIQALKKQLASGD